MGQISVRSLKGNHSSSKLELKMFFKFPTPFFNAILSYWDVGQLG